MKKVSIISSFCRKDSCDANPINYNVRMMNEMETNATAEARYVNELLK